MISRIVSVVVLVALTVLHALTADLSDQEGLARWALAALGAGAYLMGAWCAPLFAGTGSLSGTLFARWRREWDRPKALQIAAGAATSAALVLLLDFHPSSGAIVGIVVAIMLGATLSVPADPRGSDA
ncbi:hypothetical protein [Kytococcus sedentarius]|uniref:hypothetical protein n=1 Tax=Kytococcus sedentarius TaxID=1276 RepID=UPI0035BBB56A